MWGRYWQIVKDAARYWFEDNAADLGAALAYYSLVSIAPLVLIAVAIAGLVFGEEAAREQVVEQVDWMVGSEGATAVEEVMTHAKRPGAGAVATVFGLGALLFGAAGVFGQLQSSLNAIWKTPTKPTSGIWLFLRRRFFSIAMVLGTGFLLLVSLLLTAVIAAIGAQIGTFFPEWTVVLQLLNAVLSFGMITILFAMIFKMLPDRPIAWRDVWTGAIVTALLFVIGKFGIGLYLGRAAPGSTYGAAGSLVVLVLWVYYSAQILFFGAEITKVVAKMRGSYRLSPHQDTPRTPSMVTAGT